MLFGAGITDVVGEVQRATIVQLLVPDDVRGRVTALAQVFSFGGPQLGQLWSGALASLLGPILAAVIGGSLVVGIAGRFAAFPVMRRSMASASIAAAAATQRPHL
jgi:hypothetical protein